MKTSNRGFVALISVIIIAAILLIMMTEVGMAGFFARFDSLGRANSEQAELFADSCVQIALLELASSSSYSPTYQIVDLGTDPAGNKETCVIQSIVRSGSGVTVNAYGSFDNSYKSISVTED